MKTSYRTHIVFVVLVLIATFGAGQMWGLAQALRTGVAGLADVVAGIVGLTLLMVSGVVLGRFFYVLARAKKIQTQKQEVYDETQNDYI